MGDEADALMYDDPFEEDDGEPSCAPMKTCRCCGIGGLVWVSVEGKWRLYVADKWGNPTTSMHNCPIAPLPDTPTTPEQKS